MKNKLKYRQVLRYMKLILILTFTEKCVNDINEKVCEPNNEPVIIKESRSTAWVDARNCLGATSSQLGVDLAVTKAKDTGIGWVSVKGNSSFFVKRQLPHLGYLYTSCGARDFINIHETSVFIFVER